MKLLRPVLLAALLLPLTTFAQSYTTSATTTKRARNLMEDAKGALLQQQYEQAVKPLEAATNEDPKFIDAFELLGEVYGQLGAFDKADKAFEQTIVLNPDYKPKVYYFLAQSYWESDKFDEAGTAAAKFLSYRDQFDEWVAKAQTIQRNAPFAKQAVANPVPFNPKNLGPNVNAVGIDDYSPSISADNSTLIFNRNVPTGRGMPQEDFYVSTFADSAWQPARDFGEPLNTPNNEGAQKLTADGRYLFFTACNRPTGNGSCDIYVAKIEGLKCTGVKNLGFPISMQTWDSQPSISADGKDLYFTSNDRPDAVGTYDIYVSHRQPDGKWGIPENLGNVINTPEQESYPYIHPDNQTLYFASAGHPGMGGLDIFVSRRGADGKWGTPVNLGYPINTKADDNGLVVSIDGTTAYYASKPKGRNDFDLYSFTLPQGMRPVATTYVKGVIRDKVTKQPVQASVELISLNDSTRRTVINSETDGTFLQSMPTGSQYALNISKPNYLFYSANFSLEKQTDASHPYVLNVDLEPVAVGSSVVLNNVFFDVDKYNLKEQSMTELNRLYEFMQSNPKVKVEISGHTDNTGSEASNKTLSENRAKSVADYLQSKGIATARLQYKGYGSTRPVATNDTDEGRALNRRTEAKIVSVD